MIHSEKQQLVNDDDIHHAVVQGVLSGAHAFRNDLDKVIIKEKLGAADLVTTADTLIENTIINSFRQRLPRSLAYNIITEESNHYFNPYAKYTFIIDPLDGTFNFASGYDCYAISMSCVLTDYFIRGIWFPIASAVYNLGTNHLYTKYRNQVFSNGNKVKREIYKPIEKSLIGVLLPCGFISEKESTVKSCKKFTNRVGGFRAIGSPVVTAMMMLDQKIDALWFRKVKIWDVAAIVDLLQTSGNRVLLVQINDAKYIQDREYELIADNGKSEILSNNKTIGIKVL